jgi:HAE1 family hydrophobic/amphiphilic exporter-1
LIRLAGKYKNVEEKFSRVFKKRNSSSFTDIADVQDGQNSWKIARVDQKSAIILQIVKQSDANAVAVSEQVYKTITKLENDYKDNAVKLNVANDSVILPWGSWFSNHWLLHFVAL